MCFIIHDVTSVPGEENFISPLYVSWALEIALSPSTSDDLPGDLWVVTHAPILSLSAAQ